MWHHCAHGQMFLPQTLLLMFGFRLTNVETLSWTVVSGLAVISLVTFRHQVNSAWLVFDPTGTAGKVLTFSSNYPVVSRFLVLKRCLGSHLIWHTWFCHYKHGWKCSDVLNITSLKYPVVSRLRCNKAASNNVFWSDWGTRPNAET